LLLLPIVMGAIKNREASSTGLSPFFFMHGYHNEPIKLVEDRMVQDRARKDGETLAECFLERLQNASEWAQAAMAMAQEKQQQQANKTRTAAPQYKEGDWVFLNLRNVKTMRPSVTVTTVVSLTSCAPALDNALLPSTTRCCLRQCAARCCSRQCAAALDNALLPSTMCCCRSSFPISHSPSSAI
jgi:hypothetical protein